MTKKIDVVDLDEGELEQAQGGAFSWLGNSRGNNLNVGADGLQGPKAGFAPTDTSDTDI